jgi:hypothetical protein
MLSRSRTKAGVSGLMRSKVDAIRRLSDSLHVQREDHGEHLTQFGRTDVAAFLNRLAYLESAGQLSRQRRIWICRDVARILRDVRALSLTRPGRPAAGLPDDFTCHRGDISGDQADDDPGRALPED